MADADNNFNLLQKLFRIVQPQDLVGRYRVERFSNVRPDPGVIGQILKFFVDTCDPSGSGLLRFSELVEKVTALDDDVEFIKTGVSALDKHVKLYSDVSPQLAGLGSKDARTKLHVAALNTPMLGISLRDVNRVGVFLNSVPSVELGRCVPRLEVGFDLSFPGEHADAGDEGRFAAGLSARSPTLLRYINGVAGAYGSADVAMARGAVRRVDLSDRTNDQKLKEAWKQSSYVASGMELFTSPQTLTSPDSTLQTRQTPVLDRFAGLMSIDTLEVTATPAGGVFANKTARLNLVLHDRSRLHEVAALIKPDAYSRSTVSLTYGWSHPDKSGANPLADLINQMVVHDEKYNIVNSSFSFGNSGGVKITLQLSVKGAHELNIIRIADNEKFQKLDVELQRLSEAIRDARTRIPGLTKPENIKEEVRAYQIIDAAAANAELIENYSAKDKQSLTKLINQLQAGAKGNNNSALLEQLSAFLGSMDSFLAGKKERNDIFSVDNKQTNKTPRIDDLLGEKFKTMVGHQPDGTHAAAPDPYLDKDALYWKKGVAAREQAEVVAEIEGKSKEPRRFVSLAKLLLFYVGLPLQALGTIDEVQFVYYPLNTAAGYAGGTNLAAFPVEVQYFKDVMADHAKRKGNANLTAREFVQLLSSTVLQDVRHPAYGMREVYASRTPGKPLEDPKPLQGRSIEDVQNALAKATGGVFRKPVVEVMVECRGGRPIKDGETQSQKGDLRIVRIHVHDKLSSAYEPTLKVLEAQAGLEALNEQDTVGFNALRDVAQQIGLNLNDKSFNSYEQLKRFISQVTPVLNYGSNASGILAATLQTMQNSDLATVNMQRAMGPQYNSEPNGSSVSAIPLRVQPSQLDLTLIGCPLLSLAQQFFVDFSTGTTVDDLYTLTHLSHVIGAGKFESTAKLTPMNAYGSYESVASKVSKLKESIDKLLAKTNPLKTTG